MSSYAKRMLKEQSRGATMDKHHKNARGLLFWVTGIIFVVIFVAILLGLLTAEPNRGDSPKKDNVSKNAPDGTWPPPGVEPSN